MDLTAIGVGLMVILLTYIWFKGRGHNLPPYPSTPWPIVGHLFLLERDPSRQFQKWREKCGDIFSLSLGTKLLVVFNGFDLLKETFVNMGDVFEDRAPTYFDEASGFPGAGVIFSNGPNWKEQRAEMISILRGFGMSKNVLAEKISTEEEFYLEHLSRYAGQPTDIYKITCVSTANNICSIVVGQRFQYDDVNMQDIMSKLAVFAGAIGTNNIVNFFPVLKYLPGDMFHAKLLASSAKTVSDIFSQKYLQVQSRDNSEDGNTDSFIAVYRKIRSQKIAAGVKTYMDEKNLAKIIFELVLAGSETSSSTIVWCIIFVLQDASIQKKIFDEIDNNVGNKRISFLDKVKLKYLSAVIMETQRYASIIPAPFHHTCRRGVTVRGYTIPRGSYISPNLDSVMYDEKIWGSDVMTFRPERFLDEKGDVKLFKELIPFLFGHRVCPGEGIAKMELFLYLASIFQRFQVYHPDPPSILKLKHVVGTTKAPPPFELTLIER